MAVARLVGFFLIATSAFAFANQSKKPHHSLPVGCSAIKPSYECLKDVFIPLSKAELPFDKSKLSQSLDHFGPFVATNYQLVTLHRTPGPSMGQSMPYLPEYKYSDEPFHLPGLGAFLFAGGHPHAMDCKTKGVRIGDCLNQVPIEERFDIGLRKSQPTQHFLPVAQEELKLNDQIYLIHSPFLNWLSEEHREEYQKNLPIVSVGHVKFIVGNVVIVDTLSFQGSSGGTALNKRGEVVGVLSLGLKSESTNQNYSGIMILNQKMREIIKKQN